MAQCHIQWLYLAVHGCKTYLNLNLILNVQVTSCADGVVALPYGITASDGTHGSRGTLWPVMCSERTTRLLHGRSSGGRDSAPWRRDKRVIVKIYTL
jgi:hypothetical protein